MNFNPIILSIPIYFILIGIELIIQWFSKKQLYRLNDAITNISCGITQQLTGIFLKVIGVGVYTLVFEKFAVYTIASSWYMYIILFVAADFLYYWAHRMSHEVNLFWGGHVVHHQSEDYNFSVALRQGSFQILWTFAFYLPLALIGFNPIDFVFVSALVTVYQFWIHTETIGKMGWFEYIFNTPSHHRVHHGRNPKYIDKNHAGVFIIWDRLFGTFQKEEEKPTYGITTPVNSWNPVWVNFNHYAQMYRELRIIKGTRNKLKYLFKKPGWLPSELGGYRSAPEIDTQVYQKYDTKTSLSLNYYVLFQYIITLAATAFFLFTYTKMNLAIQIGIILGIIVTVISSGSLLEKNKWSDLFEIIRLVIIASIAIGYSIFYTNNTMLFVVLIYFILSFILFPNKQSFRLSIK